MANNYLQFSETLDNLKPDEEKWLSEQLATDPDTDCLVFLADYEDRDPDDPDYGFGVCFEGQGDTRSLWIYGEVYGDVERVAHLIQKFLKQLRPDQCWSLTYANTCSKLRVGEFGGGAVFVTADAIRWQNADDFIAQEQARFQAGRTNTEAAA
jgi:hypothetical protein